MPIKLVPPKAGRTSHWWIRGTHLGFYCERSTGTGDKRLAARVLKNTERDIERGVFATPQGPGFSAAATAYMRAGGDRRFLAPLIGHFKTTSLSDINQLVIDSLAATLYPDASPATLNRQVYTPISAILKRAGIDHKIKRPKGWRGQKLTTWLTPAQAFAIFRAADEIDAPADTRTEFRIFLRMLCYTGMRLSEPLRLKCADVNLDQGTAHLLTTKGGFPRLVHLPPVVVDELRRMPRGLDRPGRLFKFHVSGRLRELFAMTLEKAGVTLPHRVGFHVFSHTWATWMRMYGGLDTYDLLKTDRWSDPDSADRYAHVVVSDQSRKADLLPVEPKRKAV